MRLDDFILKKEELPILDDTCFDIPIHPRLLDPTIKISEDLAKKVFPQAVSEWYADLMEYRKTAQLDPQTKEWFDEVFLAKEPRIEIEFGHQTIGNGRWTDEFALDPNGFARDLSISRDFGGSLYFNKSEWGCKASVPMDGKGGRYLIFSREKAEAFKFREMEMDGERTALIYTYAQHNVDNFPGALFLRNWGMLYINAAIQEVAKSQSH